jgi:surface protein
MKEDYMGLTFHGQRIFSEKRLATIAQERLDLIEERFHTVRWMYQLARRNPPSQLGIRHAGYGFLSQPSFVALQIGPMMRGKRHRSDKDIHDAVDMWCSDIPDRKDFALKRYGPISEWDTSRVANMQELFSGKDEFNDDLSSWDVSQVTSMEGMFRRAKSFNRDVSSWNVSQVTKMDSMFALATSFNSDVSSWDASQVTNMNCMFDDAASFNSDVSSWNVGQDTIMTDIFLDCPIPDHHKPPHCIAHGE